MKFTRISTAFLGALALSIPLFASAHEIQGTLGVKAVVEASTTGAHVEGGAHASASTTRDDDMDEATGTDSENHATTSSHGEVHGLQNALIHVTANDAEHAEVVLQNLIDVRSQDDVAAFAKGKIKHDGHVEDVSFGTTTVGVKYRNPAKFLWFIPASILVSTNVDADGTVHVTYPWYRFLMKVPSETNIRSAVHVPNFSASTTLTAEQQAEIIDSLISGLAQARANLESTTTVHS